MLVLSVAALVAQDPGLRRSAYAFMHLYDLAIMVPLGFLSLLTGVFLSVGTNWGLFRHWWVLTKLFLTVAVLTFAGVFTNVWVLKAAEMRAADPMADLGGLGAQVLANALAFNLVFWTTTLSTVKPWGNTPHGRRQMVARRSTVRSGRRAEQPQKEG